MTRKCVADDKYGSLCRRLDEVKRRVDEGTVDYDATMDGLQFLAEGIKLAPRGAETDGPHSYRGSSPGKSTVVDSTTSTSLTPADGWAAEYQRFYREVFSLTVDFTGVEISAEQSGFGWAMYVSKGMTTNQAWAKANERFKCRSYFGDDLDKAVPKNDRTSTVAYTKRFRDCVEADEENKNLSANALAK